MTDAIADLAAEAYIYGFPALEMQRLRYNYAYSPTARFHTPFNTFRHIRKLATPNSREVTAPNNDTLYSSAWLDLSGGPVWLTTPPLGDRYYSYAFMDFFTNVFAIVGRRNARGGDGRYMLVGPDWDGETPALGEVIRSPTNAIWLLARFVVDGPADIPAVHALQNASILEGPVLDDAALIQRQSLPINASTEADVGRLFDALNSALAENPPPAADAPILQRLARIGVTPGQRFAATPAVAEAIAEGVRRARIRLDAGAEDLHQPDPGSAWSRPPSAIANFGEDYWLRAVIALALIAALPPEEAMYLSTRCDSDGAPLNGKNRYRLRFAAADLPPVNAFWSITMYEIDEDGRAWLVRNEMQRTSIGDRTEGLRYAADGGLEIDIAHSSGDPDNTLPAPAGPFTLCLRVYEPKPALLDGRYIAPAVEKVS